MREPLEMVTASLMQNMVQIRTKNKYFVTKSYFLIFGKVLLGLSTLRAPTVGPFVNFLTLSQVYHGACSKLAVFPLPYECVQCRFMILGLYPCFRLFAHRIIIGLSQDYHRRDLFCAHGPPSAYSVYTFIYMYIHLYTCIYISYTFHIHFIYISYTFIYVHIHLHVLPKHASDSSLTQN